LKKNLTHAVVAGLKPPTDPKQPQLDVWDSRKPGFGLRVTSRGVKAWMLMYRTHGRKVRLTLGRFPALSVADARARATSILGEIARGGDPAAERVAEKAAETFGELAELYLRFHAIPKKKPRSVRDDRYMLNGDLLPVWQHRKLADLKRRDVIALLDEISQRAPVKANRVRSLLSVMFGFAVRRELVEANPVYGTDQPTVERARERRLDDAELRQLWAALDAESPKVAAFFRLALLTAARKSELSGMRWDELNPKRDWWILPASRSKGNREHRIPLCSSAIALLEGLRANSQSNSDYVFAIRRGDRATTAVHRWVKRVRQRAGLAAPWHLHDLRRTTASGLAQLGVERLVISRILGHAEAGVRGIYDRHTYGPEQHAALMRWDRRLQRIVAGEPEPSNVVELHA
jgi:integrase